MASAAYEIILFGTVAKLRAFSLVLAFGASGLASAPKAQATNFDLITCQHLAAATDFAEAGLAADRLEERLARRATLITLRTLAERNGGTAPQAGVDMVTSFVVNIELPQHALGPGPARVEVRYHEGHLLARVTSPDGRLTLIRSFSITDLHTAMPGLRFSVDPELRNWELKSSDPLAPWLLLARRLRASEMPSEWAQASRPTWIIQRFLDFRGVGVEVSYASSYVSSFVDRKPIVFEPMGYRFSREELAIGRWQSGDSLLLPASYGYSSQRSAEEISQAAFRLLVSRGEESYTIPPGEHHRITILDVQPDGGISGYCEVYDMHIRLSRAQLEELLRQNLVGYRPRPENWPLLVRARAEAMLVELERNPTALLELFRLDPRFHERWALATLHGFSEWLPPSRWPQATSNGTLETLFTLRHGDYLTFLGDASRPHNRLPFFRRSYSNRDLPLWRRAFLFDEVVAANAYDETERAFAPHPFRASGHGLRILINPDRSNHGLGTAINPWFNREALEPDDILPGSLFLTRGIRE